MTIKPYEPGKHPVSFPSDAKVMYISDIAILPEYRNQGIGSFMFEYALHNIKVLGYNYIYLRTNEEHSMSYNIARRNGFNQVSNIVQEVEMKRVDGTVSKDRRIFMVKVL